MAMSLVKITQPCQVSLLLLPLLQMVPQSYLFGRALATQILLLEFWEFLQIHRVVSLLNLMFECLQLFLLLPLLLLVEFLLHLPKPWLAFLVLFIKFHELCLCLPPSLLPLFYLRDSLLDALPSPLHWLIATLALFLESFSLLVQSCQISVEFRLTLFFLLLEPS